MLICLSAHSFPPRRFPLMYACCVAGGFLTTWGGTRWLGMLLHSLFTSADLTWTHPSPSHLPYQQKEHNWKNEIFPTFFHRCPSFITCIWQEVGGFMRDVRAVAPCTFRSVLCKHLHKRGVSFRWDSGCKPRPKIWKGLVWQSQTFEHWPKIWSTLKPILAKKRLLGHLTNHLYWTISLFVPFFSWDDV